MRVTHDEKTITMDDGAGTTAVLAWADLVNVTALTTDGGPFQTDLFWMLTDHDGRNSLLIPMGAQGEHELLLAMQTRLPGFDNMAVVEAMSSTTNGVFQIWPAASLT